MAHARRARWLFRIGTVIALWAAAVAVTGGFVVDTAWLHFSSRRPRNAAVFAAVLLIASWWFATPEQREYAYRVCRRTFDRIGRALALVERIPPWTATALAIALAAAVTVLGFHRGAFVAGGHDVYGYVSQAHLLASGRLRVEQPLAREWTWPHAAQALVPAGYNLAPDGSSIVPLYPPGFPMVMAAFELVAGRNAVYWVVPILAGVAVWTTYVIGRRVFNRSVGLAASVLLATSPVLALQTILPMSDVPVTAWWTIALTFLLSRRPQAALVAGLAAGLALVTRPNLVLVPAVCAVWVSRTLLRERSLRALVPLVAFSLAVALAGATIAWLNWQWRGSAFKFGYAPVELLFSWSHVPVNLASYSQWLFDVHTPVVLLALLSPFAVPAGTRLRDGLTQTRHVIWFWAAAITAVAASYVFYTPFDHWLYLRFLLPIFPILFVLTAAGAFLVIDRIRPQNRALLATLLTLAVVWRGLDLARDRGLFQIREGEQRAIAAAAYISRRLPEKAVFIGNHETGSVRYYADRLTINFVAIHPPALESAIEDMRQRGYHPYILLEEFEESSFRETFRGHSPIAELDWRPVALIDYPIEVRIYDPAQQSTSDRSRVTDVVSDPSRATDAVR